MLPVLSWLWLRGRCRACGGRISIFYPAIELAALAVAVWSLWVLSGWQVLAGTLLGWFLLVLAWIDARHFYLPDALTLPLIASGLVFSWIADPGGWWAYAGGALLGFAVFAGIARLYRAFRGVEGLGLGDAKLFAAAGAWLSWWGLPSVLLIAALSGLLFALFVRPSKGRTGRRVSCHSVLFSRPAFGGSGFMVPFTFPGKAL